MGSEQERGPEAEADIMLGGNPSGPEGTRQEGVSFCGKCGQSGCSEHGLRF